MGYVFLWSKRTFRKINISKKNRLCCLFGSCVQRKSCEWNYKLPKYYIKKQF